MGRVPEAKGLMGAPDHLIPGYSVGEMFKMDRTSPAPLSQVSRAYLSPELMMGRSPEGYAMDHNMAGRYQMMSPQQDLPPYRPSIQVSNASFVTKGRGAFPSICDVEVLCIVVLSRTCTLRHLSLVS